MVKRICNEHVAKMVDSNALRSFQLCCRGWTAITAVTFSTGACQCNHGAVRINFSDSIA
jgi:hypothetical protein